eukprot:354145-Chlamydomonas_euryale.AAC.1
MASADLSQLAEVVASAPGARIDDRVDAAAAAAGPLPAASSGSAGPPPAAPQAPEQPAAAPLAHAPTAAAPAGASAVRPRRASDAPSGPADRAKHAPFVHFAERHARLLNAYVRRSHALLEGSLAPLMRLHKLIDFDNKRTWFRAKVRAHDSERPYGTLRVNVRREHVFEDSFHQLRSRTPEEMRLKLSVQFTGEEGIDAGGLSREWFQVRVAAAAVPFPPSEGLVGGGGARAEGQKGQAGCALACR